jgi:hypothetical protein
VFGIVIKVEGNTERIFYPNTSSLSDFWYFVGVVATDGCLLKDGRHISITAADSNYLQLIANRFHLPNKVTPKLNGAGQVGYHLQLGNARLWRTLFGLGLTPKKSLTMGPLKVPSLFFNDFLRGVIDGDGNIRRWIHPQNGREQWELRIYSSALLFTDWLYAEINRNFGVTGCKMTTHHVLPKHTAYRIKYGKMAGRVILAKCYERGTLALPRKRQQAEQWLASQFGWTRSLTIL